MHVHSLLNIPKAQDPPPPKKKARAKLPGCSSVCIHFMLHAISKNKNQFPKK